MSNVRNGLYLIVFGTTREKMLNVQKLASLH